MNEGMGPSIWLAGDPADLKKWMNSGIEGIVTNTVVQRELTEKYGSLINLTKEYLDITDKKIAIEIDGESTQELLDVGEVFTKMSDQIILKIPCSEIALDAFSFLKKEGIETFCTTVFSLNQAVSVAQAGADHILPFCEPMKEIGVSPSKLVKENSNIQAFDLGFKRSIVTILDANITTLIASIILFIFGSGPIKGFAVTLSVGLVTTLFSAYFISRHLSSIIVFRNKEKKITI